MSPSVRRKLAPGKGSAVVFAVRSCQEGRLHRKIELHFSAGDAGSRDGRNIGFLFCDKEKISSTRPLHQSHISPVKGTAPALSLEDEPGVIFPQGLCMVLKKDDFKPRCRDEGFNGLLLSQGKSTRFNALFSGVEVG
ncbi:hypothetical protein SDC9_138704 [bioreactor metagenome]|uniref:Uncharacterized protein n=1 Tax=bioreactor metagenome TaxID=1076179 RepID=A0A645DSB8_9ZZZZ